MKYKAQYKGKSKDRNGYAVHLFYEYRGHEYMITDEHNGYSEPMYIKHKNEQARIDAMIEDENKPPTNGSDAWEAFCQLMDYFEQ